MGVTPLDPVAVSDYVVRTLALDGDAVDLVSVEALAASLRRAASFLCPTTPRALVRSVMEVLPGLPGVDESTEARVDGVLASLIAYGDLLELPLEEDGRAQRQIFLGSPMYVRRTNACLLVGVRPDGAPIVGEERLDQIEYNGHARLLRIADSEALADLVEADAITELRADQWLRAPRASTAEELANDCTQRLLAAEACGDIDGLRLIDPKADVTYYRGRWRVPTHADDGAFVARRPQAFGADLWCFALLSEGHVTRLLDLPLRMSLAPGADEAWRLQAALDAVAGNPQLVRTRSGVEQGSTILDLYGPIPSWAQRSLDVLGTPLPRSRGALLSYSLPTSDVDDQIRFLEDMIWTSAPDAGESSDHGE